jgi:hypothetical protein
MSTREQNERKFRSWQALSDGGRRYWLDVQGRHGRRARYVKVVDADENTLLFYQEIYEASGKLVERHEKFPVDRGHQAVESEP